MSKTRSGLEYKRASGVAVEHRDSDTMTEPTGAEPEATVSSAAEMVKLLMADRERREEQMERLVALLEASAAATTRTPTPTGLGQEKVKVTKLTDQDDIEAYLTTFERLMEVHSAGRRTVWRSIGGYAS